MKKNLALAIGGLLIAIGVVLLVVDFGEDFVPECAEPGAPYSGFVDGDCNLTDESYAELVEIEGQADPANIVGLVLILVGLGAGTYGVVRRTPRDTPATG